MPTIKMHENEIQTSPGLVRRLLAAQFPQWAGLPIRRVSSTGTDNAIYRLGDQLAVRLPRIDWATGQIAKEAEWLPRLAGRLPLEVSTQVAQGRPGEGYPWAWAIYRWIEGESALLARLANPVEEARRLAAFVRALQQIDPSGGPDAVALGLRGGPLSRRDVETRAAIESMAGLGLLERNAALGIWQAALAAPAWRGAPVWFHGDLMAGNVLVRDGRIAAVIDFSALGVGDPAIDLMIAWHLFEGESRAAFRAALAVDEATWVRGRGLALSVAVIYIPYYLESNPHGVTSVSRMLAGALAG